VQILLFLPLTLAALGKAAFLLLSLLLFVHSIIYGTLMLFWNPNAISLIQQPVYFILLLFCFSTFSESVPQYLTTATVWWEWILTFSGPLFVIMESLSSLLVVQKLGQQGRRLVQEGESYQFGLLIATAATYVASAWWIAASYPAAAASPLTSTLLGVALTAFIFLTLIGFVSRRTNIIESSGLSLFIAYNIWLCGVDQRAISNPSSYAPLVPNIIPHLQALMNFLTNTLPMPVLVGLLYRLTILHLASRILPTIGADAWVAESNGSDDLDDRPTSVLTRTLLTYRMTVFVTVYSHLLLLNHSSHVGWRWMNIFLTLVIWSVELLVSSEDDIAAKDWKVD